MTEITYQLHEPQELIKLLQPLIAELLKLNIDESQEEFARIISPLIDGAIRNRTEVEKDIMGESLAPIIPPAISHQIQIAPEEFAEAIAPTMGSAIKKQVENEKDEIIDALYPVIGSTIAKYMAETVRTINQKIENTLSTEGIKRKIRAKLQGVSEAELILREAIPLRVQAVFLIHKISGLVIAEIQPSEQQTESDMFAGMLTAIRSFANDCIANSHINSELNAIDYGASQIILEVAGYCYLAIVIQGEPTQEFKWKVRQTLSNIIKQYGDIIENFIGDQTIIPEQVNNLLETLRNSHQLKKSSSKVSPLSMIAGISLAAICLPWGAWQYHNNIIGGVEHKTTLALASTPELAVYRLTVQSHRGKLQLSGKVPNQPLRQKAEQVAQNSAPQWQLDNQILAVEIPPDPVLAADEVKRVTRTLNQITGVAIATTYSEGLVKISGTVKHDQDILKVSHAFEQIPGVKTISSFVRAQPLKVGIRFYFRYNSANLLISDYGYKLQQVKSFLQRHPQNNLKIIGYSNDDISPISSGQLALARAKSVQQALIHQGVEPSRLRINGSTNLPLGVDKTQPTWLRRCVVLEVVQ
ncbi:hypothetical protein IJ00_12955 [Calothrix sp. 336/3]|nr:hypothetical protein IJ00_12955 [Calothrix sp. 336/3]